MKFDIKRWLMLTFIAFGAVSLFLIVVDLIFDRFKDEMTITLLSIFIYIFTITSIAFLLEKIACKNKILYYCVMESIIFAAVFLLLFIRAYIDKGELKIASSLLLALFGIFVGGVALIIVNVFQKLRQKRMNRKLKEYQDNHED